MIYSKSDLIINPAYKCTTESKINELFLHIDGGSVPLWEIGSIITWTVQSATFPTLQHADYTKNTLQDAIDEWKIKNLKFVYVDEKHLKKATFFIKYTPYWNGLTLASAFFPNEHQNEIVVYPLSFSSWIFDQFKNTLMHEMGHVYGLRHEFALKEGDTTEFGPSNKESVMNYNAKPIIQDTDREWLQKLYDPKEPLYFITNAQQYPIKRYEPFSFKYY